MSESEEEQGNASDINSYNIAGKLGGLGQSILIHVVHEMEDGHDVQTLLCASKCTHDIMSDHFFGWSVARVLSNTYSLRTVPLEFADVVCFWISLLSIFPLPVSLFYSSMNVFIITWIGLTILK